MPRNNLVMKHSRAWLAVLIVLAVLIIDQLIKIWVKTHMFWGEDIEVLPWFHLRFVQNNGMAFGMEFGSKLFLSLFRVVAVAGLLWVLYRLCKDNGRKYPVGLLVCLSLVTAGAAGNIIDCLFYGEIFNNPYPPEVASFVPWGEGYSSLFHGLVVDMFYFPLFSFEWPDWMPWLGGRSFSFFDPVFNFADAAISVGMVVLILFYSKYLGGSEKRIEEKVDE